MEGRECPVSPHRMNWCYRIQPQHQLNNKILYTLIHLQHTFRSSKYSRWRRLRPLLHRNNLLMIVSFSFHCLEMFHIMTTNFWLQLLCTWSCKKTLSYMPASSWRCGFVMKQHTHVNIFRQSSEVWNVHEPKLQRQYISTPTYACLLTGTLMHMCKKSADFKENPIHTCFILKKWFYLLYSQNIGGKIWSYVYIMVLKL